MLPHVNTGHRLFLLSRGYVDLPLVAASPPVQEVGVPRHPAPAPGEADGQSAGRAAPASEGGAGQGEPGAASPGRGSGRGRGHLQLTRRG